MERPGLTDIDVASKRRVSAGQVALLYALFGVLWILGSDWLALQLVGGDLAALARVQTYKGWFFIGVTATGLYWLVRLAVAEAREAERQLQQAEYSFRAMLEGMRDPVFIHDPESGRILYVNNATTELYGFSREQLCSAEVGDLSAGEEPFTQVRALEWIHRAKPGEGLLFEWRGRHRDGHLMWLEINISRVQVASVEYVLAAVRNIDERKRIEVELRRSEENYRQAQAVAKVGSWRVDIPGKTLEWSDETYRIFGRTRDMPLSLEIFYETIHREDRDRVRAASDAALSGEPFDIEHRIIVGDEVRWVRERAEVVRDERGQAVGRIGTVQDITERHALEDAQRQLLVHLDSVANASPALLWTSAPDGGLDWVNQRWLEFCGGSLEDQLGDAWIDLIHPLDSEFSVRTYREAMAARRPYSMEYRLRRADGAYRWLLEHGTPRLDADGAFLGFIGSSLDVTREREVQEALWTSEERLRLALEAAHQGLYDTDMVTGKVTVSPSYASMLGYDPIGFEETHESWLSRLHPDDRHRVIDTHRRYLTGELPAYRVEFRMATCDGSWKWILSVGGVVERDAEGRAIRMIGTHTDIDALKRTEAELERFRFIVENAGQELYLVRPDGSFFYVNETAARSLGYSQGELMSMGVPDIDPMIDSDAFRVHFEELKAGDLPRFETVHVSRTGRKVPKEIKSVYLRMGDEEYVCGFAQDITERKQADEALFMLNSDLERRVVERTAQLESANKELEAFSYSVSHDLKAPLRGIAGYSQLLQEACGERLDADEQAFIAHIRRGVDQMHELIEDLLAYSREDRRHTERHEMELQPLIESVIGLIADENRRRCHFEFDLAVNTLRTDRDGLGLILRNLCENAVKFAKDGDDPRIVFRSSERDGKVLLCVADNGIGFDMKYHDKIFDIFQRLHHAETYAGTGVGLALVSKAVQRLGGRVWAESVLGDGARFFVELPQ